MKQYLWAVVGAGPAGIAAMGQLIDHGIDPQSIIWVDPEFKGGDLAKYWMSVSSNTKVKLFKKFFKQCRAFNYTGQTALDEIPDDQTCKLELVCEPLQIASDNLLSQVNSYTSHVDRLYLYDRRWHMSMHDQQVISAQNVILATGSVPRTVPAPEGVEIISIYDALNPKALSARCHSEDTVAVFGSSHTAVILLRELLDLGVKQVINFYRQPLRFAVELDNFILFDNTGLKGEAAKWAREYLNGKLPSRLTRFMASDENINQHLPLCTKAIYAIGFIPRVPVIEGYSNIKYNPHTGIIAPGLFGVGIAFPESRIDPYGNTELSVGLWKFMTYLTKVIPIWLKYGV